MERITSAWLQQAMRGSCFLLSSSQQGGFVSCPCSGRTVLLANQVCLWKAVFLESGTNITTGQHKLQVLPAWTNLLIYWDCETKGKRLVKGVRLRDDAGTATGRPVLAIEASRANPCPDPSHTKGTHCVATWLPGGGKVRGAAPAGGQPAALFWGIWQRDHTASVGMDKSRLQQWLSTGVDTSD